MNYITEQELFWAEKFGQIILKGIMGKKLLASNLNFFKSFESVL